MGQLVHEGEHHRHGEEHDGRQAIAPEVPIDDRPGVEEDDLDVEHDEAHRDQVEAHREPLERLAAGHDPALVG